MEEVDINDLLINDVMTPWHHKVPESWPERKPDDNVKICCDSLGFAIQTCKDTCLWKQGYEHVDEMCEADVVLFDSHNRHFQDEG